MKYLLTIWKPILIATLFSLFLLFAVPRESIGIYIHATQPFVRVACVLYAVYLLTVNTNFTSLIISLCSFVILFCDFFMIIGVGLVLNDNFTGFDEKGVTIMGSLLGSYLAVSIGFMAIAWLSARFMDNCIHKGRTSTRKLE